ncbi:restriction endonuclease subunit S [Methylobacter marinus]|uniref:restriction endonuclease subunit S n=1 Tax=Methylobacter marinus TaxID=34058 RepID=UPI000366C77F|nr:restriction endonuclease subunit S [Methylobacter marinus]
MRSSWQELPLGDAPLQIIDGDRGKAYPKHSDFLNDGHCLFLNATNVTVNGFNFSDCQFISEQKDDELRKGKLARNDVVLTTRGTLGNSAYYRKDIAFDHVRINSGMVIIRTDLAQLLPEFVYGFIRSPSFECQVEQLRSGVAQPQLPIRDLSKIKIPLPPVNVQEKIVDVFSSYDALIENNRRRMALLEESARLLYREWFVRLRFPGYKHTRIVDGVPSGWKRKSLGDLCCEIRELVSPSSLEPDTPYIGLEHMPRRSIALNEWGKVDEVTSSKSRFKAGEILFGKIRPYFHKVGVAFVDGVASSDSIVIRPTDNKLHGLVLMTMSSDEFVAVTTQQMKEGSKMPRADWKQMQAYPVPLPPEGLLNAFDDVIQPIIAQLKSLTFTNQKLRAARDLLLPRLMSGEITV